MTELSAAPAASYAEVLGRLVATGSRGMKAGPERVQALLEHLDNPQRGLRGVLVAGTNGKGSVCAMVDSMVRAAGIRSVMLTKPHLRSYRERFAVDGANISGARFALLAERVLAAGEEIEASVGAPTQFEILTAMGILLASEEPGALCICEVGLGGRLDATNVLDLGIAVITTVALDHMDVLGDTVEAVAAEKAGIIKAGDTVVTAAGGPAGAVIAARAHDVGTQLVVVAPPAGRTMGLDGIEIETTGVAGGPLTVQASLSGAFQETNLATAVAVCRVLAQQGAPIDDDAIRRGAATVRWPGRVTWVPGQPALLLDAAHNPAAVAALVPAVLELSAARHVVLLFGAMQDKDAPRMLDLLRPLGEYAVMTQPGTLRARPATELAQLWGQGARAVNSLPDALTVARLLAGGEGVVLVTGSLYLVGDVLALLEHESTLGKHESAHGKHESALGNYESGHGKHESAPPT